MSETKKGALVIFTKDAELSAVKTRLARETTQDFARKFYDLSLKATFETLSLIKKQNPNSLSLYYALDKKESLKNQKWHHNKLISPLWTGSTDLAMSLNHIYLKLIQKYDFVIMIGMDSPQLTTSDFNQVINWCQKLNHQNKCLIGPSLDGGFYLFASNRTLNFTLNSKIFLDIKYSKNNTLSSLVKKLNSFNIQIDYLEEQIDIDTKTDLIELKNRLKQNKNLTPSQQNLYDWLNL